MDEKPSALCSSYLSASAGSGKTYALSVRFCEQVMAHVPPDEICALTFTRAATREIFSAVIERLVKQEVKPFPGSLSREEALKRILEALPRLQISTIDAFSAKVARLFAYELGLNPDLTLYEEKTGAEAEEILREVIRRALRSTSQRSADELFHRFNLSSRGTSGQGNSVAERLQNFLNQYQDILQAHPTGWGELPPDSDLPHQCTERIAKIDTLRTYIERCPEAAKLSASTKTNYLKLLDEYHPEVENLRQLMRLWGNSKWKNADRFRTLATEGTYASRGKAIVELDAEGHTIAHALWEDLLARDLEQTATHTRALFDALYLLDKTAKQYLTEVGKIGFTALTKTLAETIGSRLSLFDPKLLYIAYRLDTSIRHLMIDEFQDTGTDQWTVLSNIAHELASDAEHSFFYVGDTKQSIYGWRGGDATLFGDTTRVPDIPQDKELRVSYRSSPTVIDFINTAMTFSEAECKAAEAWQVPVLTAWRTHWKDHIAHRTKDKGYAALITLAGNQNIWLSTIADIIAKRWQEVAEHSISIAVLAPSQTLLRGSSNTVGLLTLLRERGVPCAIDGKNKITETQLGRLVARLLHWLNAPDSTLWPEVVKHIGLLDTASKSTPDRWMQIILEEGFVGWLEHCFGSATPLGKRLTAFDHSVLAALRQGFEALDMRGEKDPYLAQRAIENLEIPCISNRNVVTLMTIHHSKGLTFDLVYTILHDAFVSESKVTYETGKDWVLEKPVLSEQYDRLKPLQQARIDRNTARFQDGLCALYVAITRARSEQIVFAPESACKSSNSRVRLILPHFVEEYASQLTEMPPYRDMEGTKLAFEAGDETWFHAAKRKVSPETSRSQTLPPWQVDLSDKPIEVDLPSEHSKVATIEELLRQDATRGAQYGISLHETYARIAWTDHPPHGHFPNVFKRPDEPCELWRERSFAVTLSEDATHRYIAGQFDRVHLFPQSKRAIIYDFKTTQSPGRTEAYDRQLREYRTALAALTGYPIEAIRTFLLFTHNATIEEVPHV